GEAANRIDLVDEDDHWPGVAGEQDFLEDGQPALQRAQPLASQPEVVQFFFQVELLAEAGDEAVIPLLGGEGVADEGEIEDGDGDTFRPQTSSGVDHEGAFAHLASVEDVAELAAAQASVQIAVCLALDVGGGVLAQGAAGSVEARGGSAHRWRG